MRASTDAKPHRSFTTAQLLDISINFPVFVVALQTARIAGHNTAIVLFSLATPLIPLFWYSIFIGIEHRDRLRNALSSRSFIWRAVRLAVGISAGLVSVLLLLFVKKQGRADYWLVSAATFWFALLAVASFWPRARKFKSENHQESPSSAIASTESTLVTAQRIARLGDRIVAAVLDGVLILPVSFFLTGELTARWYRIPTDQNGGFTLNGGPALLSITSATALWCLYYFFAEWLSGSTLGKEVMGIQVLASSGEKCGPARAFVRNLLRPVDAFGFYLVGFVAALLSPTNQSLGDRTAGTTVRESPLTRRKLAFFAWLLLLTGFIAGAPALFRLFPR